MKAALTIVASALVLLPVAGLAATPAQKEAIHACSQKLAQRLHAPPGAVRLHVDLDRSRMVAQQPNQLLLDGMYQGRKLPPVFCTYNHRTHQVELLKPTTFSRGSILK